MERVDLTVTKRDTFKKNESRRLRSQGKTPGVLYGHGIETMSISVDTKSVKQVIRQHVGRNFLFNLIIEQDSTANERWAIIRELQKDPVTEEYVHIDLYELKRGEKIHVTVPIRLKGSPPGVKAGGILEHIMRDLEVKCLPKDIPEFIEVDVSELDINDSIHISDLKVDEFEIIGETTRVIAAVVTHRGPATETPIEEEPTEPELVGGKGKEEEEE